MYLAEGPGVVPCPPIRSGFAGWPRWLFVVAALVQAIATLVFLATGGNREARAQGVFAVTSGIIALAMFLMPYWRRR